MAVRQGHVMKQSLREGTEPATALHLDFDGATDTNSAVVAEKFMVRV